MTLVVRPTGARPRPATMPELTHRQIDTTGVSRTVWRVGRGLVTLVVFAGATVLGVEIGLGAPTTQPAASAPAPVVGAPTGAEGSGR